MSPPLFCQKDLLKPIQSSLNPSPPLAYNSKGNPKIPNIFSCHFQINPTITKHTHISLCRLVEITTLLQALSSCRFLIRHFPFSTKSSSFELNIKKCLFYFSKRNDIPKQWTSLPNCIINFMMRNGSLKHLLLHII